MTDYDITEHLRRIESTAEGIGKEVGDISGRLRGVERDVTDLLNDWLGPREDRWRGEGPDPVGYRGRVRVLWGDHKDRKAVRAFVVTVVGLVGGAQVAAAVALWLSWLRGAMP